MAVHRSIFHVYIYIYIYLISKGEPGPGAFWKTPSPVGRASASIFDFGGCCIDETALGAHQGPGGAHKGPRGAHKGPRGAHKSPRRAHKGPRGAHKGPRLILFVFRKPNINQNKIE